MISSSAMKRVKKTASSKHPQFSFKKIIDAAKQEATGAKTSSYLVTTIAVGFVYTVFSLIVLAFVPVNFQVVAWLILSFVFAMAFSPIRYALEELIRQLFPGSDYDSHELIKKLNTISYSSLTLNELSRMFFEAFDTRFEVPETAFIFIDPNDNHVIKTSDRFQNIQSLTSEELSILIKRVGRSNDIVRRFKDDTANLILKDYHIKVIVPLVNNDSLLGLLLLGGKYSQKPYTTKDIKVLSAIAPKIGFATKNAFEFESVSIKNEKLISELKDTNEKLRIVNKQLRHDDRLKDEFVYVATHELKNPVTAMRGYVSLLMEGKYGRLSGKVKEALNQVNASNQQLIGLLNNLLQIARSEAQKLDIKTRPVVICQIIDQVINDLKPLSDQKNIAIIHTCPNPAVAVMADKERLREIISNLISNSIKYSDQGVIQINHEINQDKLVTHISDQGVGISESDQKKIFTRFFRVEEEAAKGIPGTGLGLFIVKQLIEKMNGSISFKSVLDQGSTFSFSLPLAHTYALKSE